MLIPYISLCCNYLHLYTCMSLFIIFQPTFFFKWPNLQPPSLLSLSPQLLVHHTICTLSPHRLPSIASVPICHPARLSPVLCRPRPHPSPTRQLPIGLSYTTSPPPRTCIVHRPTRLPSSLVIYPLSASSPSTAHTLPCGLVSHELNNMTRGKRR
jgi:hypothetical protein